MKTRLLTSEKQPRSRSAGTRKVAGTKIVLDPDRPPFRDRGPEYFKFYVWMKEHLDDFRGMTLPEIERRTRQEIRQGTPVYDLLRENGLVGRFQTFHPYHLMNFDLGNVDLAKIWNVSIKNIIARRCRHRLGTPRWYGTCTLSLAKDREYHAAVAAEQKKAESYYRENKSANGGRARR